MTVNKRDLRVAVVHGCFSERGESKCLLLGAIAKCKTTNESLAS